MTRNGSDQMDQIYLILIRPSFNGKRVRDASIYTSKKYRSSFYS